jgi:D-xylulose kinase
VKYVIGIDLGTSGTKTALFDQNGRAIASATQEYPLHQPQNGWAEQDPADWWNACVATLQQVLTQSGISAADIAGIGLSGQMHGLVMLDEQGQVLRNSILWCDGRTGRECEEITQLVGAERLIELTANPALTGFTAGKILWVRRHEPELYARCRQMMLPKDYLRYKLTGVYATEVSDASGTNLLDVPNRRWSAEVLEKLSIDPSLLPPIYESCAVTGQVTHEAAALTGLAAGTPVVGGAADNAAAAVGTGVVRSGRAFTTIGTSGVIFAHADTVSIDRKGRVHTFCSAVPGAWTVMSCTLSAGGSLQWFRNQLCQTEMQAATELGVDPYELMSTDAEKSPIGANRLLFLPYLMGERSPILDADARGVFFGLSGIHAKRDMTRAVMEGVTYSLRQCLDVLVEMGIAFETMLATGGGAKSPFWRQMMADLYRCEVTTIDSQEGPALGAAILAAVGAGLYPDVETACDAIITTNPPQQPNAAHTAQYEPYYQLYASLYPALKEQFSALAALATD